MTTSEHDEAAAAAGSTRLRLAGIGLVLVAVVAGGAWYAMTPPGPSAERGPVPDFAAIDDVKERKKAFFGFIAPMVDEHNEWILENRAFLQELRDEISGGGEPSTGEAARVQGLADRYRVDAEAGVTLDLLDELLYRCDVIPVSLALAQAASESAWGTSRFAREGNNYFGEWCFEEGCGMVPGRRGAGQTHEVEVFDDVEDSVASYARNLNRVGVYDRVRDVRARAREQGRPLDSEALAAGLLKYSERGQHYVDELRAIISYNKLKRFDQTLLARMNGDADRG